MSKMACPKCGIEVELQEGDRITAYMGTGGHVTQFQLEERRRKTRKIMEIPEPEEPIEIDDGR